MTGVWGTRKIEAMRAILFIFGIVLIAGAFLAAALELAAHAVEPKLSVVSGFGSVLRALAPETLELLLERFAWKGWDILLSLPGWLVFGVPGFALLVFARSRNDEAAQQEYEHTLFLFDELSEQASEQDDLNANSDLGKKSE